MSAGSEPGWKQRRAWARDAIVCDGLLPWTSVFLPPHADLVEQLTRFHRAGVDHVSVTAAAGKDGPAEALARIGYITRCIQKTDGAIRFAASKTDIAAAKASGAMSVGLHFQTATPFVPDLDLVRGFRAAGVGRAILAYNEANVFADGCHEPRDSGLTQLGKRLLQTMDEADMIVDLSHCGINTSLEAMQAPLRRTPVFSHSNARALYDHERNLTDEQIVECGRRGGYIGISGVGMFLGTSDDHIPDAMAEHVAYVANKIGADRVGLGLDFMFLEGSDYKFFFEARSRWPRGYPPPPWSFLQPEQIEPLVEALERKGFSDAELQGVLGLNYLRLAT
jgi:membrane dipeptidase